MAIDRINIIPIAVNRGIIKELGSPQYIATIDMNVSPQARPNNPTSVATLTNRMKG